MKCSLLTAAITGAIAASTAVSSSAEAVLEEVIVTATKRGEFNVQSLAEAIYAVDGDSMKAKNQYDFEAIAGSIPGLQFQDMGPGDKEYIIRGINGNGPAVVGAYFDEYVITANDQQDGGGKNAPIKLVDLERVEVLNGPQGTLYGANSMAGNIRFISKKANTSAVESFIYGDVSETDEGGSNYTLNGMINLPIVEDVLRQGNTVVAMRISIQRKPGVFVWVFAGPPMTAGSLMAWSCTRIWNLAVPLVSRGKALQPGPNSLTR